MSRRFPWRKLFLGALCLVPLGCEPHRSFVRSNEGDDIMANAANPSEDDLKDRKVIGGSSDDATSASSFFKKNRRSGGWSDEAREIESHLGAD